MEYNLFFRPKGGFCADFIPFYADGSFRLFYLFDKRGADGYG